MVYHFPLLESYGSNYIRNGINISGTRQSHIGYIDVSDIKELPVFRCHLWCFTLLCWCHCVFWILMSLLLWCHYFDFTTFLMSVLYSDVTTFSNVTMFLMSCHWCYEVTCILMSLLFWCHMYSDVTEVMELPVYFDVVSCILMSLVFWCL